MKVLMIEDNADDIVGIIDYCSEQGWEQEVKNFDECFQYIEECDPDIVILDLQDKSEEETFTGRNIIKRIWEKSFRPVCVFSGHVVNPNAEKEEYPSPLIEFYPKGDESPVIKYLSAIAPYAHSIKEMQIKMNNAFRSSFEVLRYLIKDQITDENIMGYLCNNRIKEYFSNDEEDIKLPPWGQYIYPVLSKNYSTGDIVCETRKYNSCTSAKNFYIVLSQSCDLAHRKVNNILLAKCCSINSVIKKKKDEDLTQGELESLLNEGYIGKYFPLPKLEGVIPDLVVNLKDLHTMSIESFLSEYRVIVSMSSPYRERLVWAYMQNACRPGVPTLDVKKWAESIIPDDGSKE